MQQNISLVYDLLFLIVFAVVAVCSWHKGFLASLAELIGAVFGVGIAVWASQTAAPQIYEKFLSASVANRVELALRESNDIAEALQGISFLPESMQQSLLNLLNDAGSDVPAKIAEALQPLILPFVQVLLFVLLMRSSMFSRSWSDIPNCFIRSSTGWMCISRAQVRQ